MPNGDNIAADVHGGTIPDDLGPRYRHGEAQETPSPRTQLLIDANAAIGGDRQRDYGPVVAGFDRIAAMWSAILGVTVTAEQYAMCQVATKIGRLAESPNHRDSWLDVAGYAALGAEVANTARESR